MASTELGRFKIVREKRELLLPTVSAFNRADNEEWYIDTDYDSDEGRIYIGKSDFEDMARTVGWVKSDAYNNLFKAYNELSMEHDSLVNSVNVIRELLPRLNSLLNLDSSSDNTPGENQLLLDFECGDGGDADSDEPFAIEERSGSFAIGSDSEESSSFGLGPD